jgi:diguanylate cyclase (GGDEF) domain
MGEGVLILDKRDQIVLVNEALVAKLRLPESSIVGHRICDFDWVKDEKALNQSMPWDVAQESNERQLGVRLSLKVGQGMLVFLVNAVPVGDGKGKSIGVIASFNDITELETQTQRIGDMEAELAQKGKDIDRKNRELHYLGSRDPLTNCYNRRTLFSQLGKCFEKRSSAGAEFSLIIVGIDHFKAVNNNHGHVVGDEIILGLAETLVFNIRPGDIVARIGGEEFCILLSGAPPDKAYALAEMFRKKIEVKTISGLKVTASFGVSSIRNGAVEPNELIQQADDALTESKRNGRNRTTSWNPKANSRLADPVAHDAITT